jgi:hypothetical protein
MTIISEAVVLLAGMSLLAAQAPQQRIVEVTETNQSTYRADFAGFDADSINVLNAQTGTPRQISFENILRLRFASKSTPAKPELSMAVEMRGGSRIVASDLTSDGKNVTITAASGPLVFPSKAVNNCMFRKLTAELLPQWKSFVESQVASDMLVLERSDDSLDKIEGLIGKVTSEFVSFDVDGQNVEAPREKLAGIKYFSADMALGPLAGVVRDVHRNEWIISSIISKGDSCTLKLNCGESVTLPMADLIEIDLSYGNSRYVAEMEPLERTSQPRFELGIELADAAKLFGARKVEATAGPGLKGPSVEFIGAGAATYRVPAGFTKLVGAVELKPGGQAFMACRAAVMLENKTLWEHNFDATRKPQEISLAVESDKRLRLVVESKADHPLGDIIIWKELRLLK